MLQRAKKLLEKHDKACSDSKQSLIQRMMIQNSFDSYSIIIANYQLVTSGIKFKDLKEQDKTKLLKSQHVILQNVLRNNVALEQQPQPDGQSVKWVAKPVETMFQGSKNSSTDKEKNARFKEFSLLQSKKYKDTPILEERVEGQASAGTLGIEPTIEDQENILVQQMIIEKDETEQNELSEFEKVNAESVNEEVDKEFLHMLNYINEEYSNLDQDASKKQSAGKDSKDKNLEGSPGEEGPLNFKKFLSSLNDKQK